jgi:transposase-like protein
MPTRKTYSGAFKARVALEMLKGQRTANEIGTAYGIHPVQAAQWKKQAAQALPGVLEDRRHREDYRLEAERDELFAEIGRLRMQLEWLKKKSGITPVGSA